MSDFDIKLPQMKTIEELSQSCQQLKERERQQAKALARRRKARAEAARRRRLRNRLVVVGVACIAIAILAVALNRDKTANLPGQGNALDSPVGSYNDNDHQGNDVNAVTPVDPEQPAEPEQPKTEAEKAVAYAMALGKGETTYDHADTSGRISQNKSAKKMVALTFDDGPYPGKTEAYLKILQEYDVPATFFCLGSYVAKNPEQAKAIVDAGCELASHSWDHKNMPKQSKEIIQEDFRKTAAAFQEAVGFAPYLFRAPYGATNEDLRQVAAANGASMIFWSVDTNDWKKPAADTLVNRAVNDARDGSIILMHENKANTLEALPTIISYLQAKGYELVTVSRLLYENSAQQAADAGTAADGAGQGASGDEAGTGANGGSQGDGQDN